MLRLLTALAVLATAHVHALKCVTIGDEQQAWGNCSKPVQDDNGKDTMTFASACYYAFPDTQSANAGCVPVQYGANSDLSKPGCSADKSTCWCVEDNCNDAATMEAYRKSYTPPPSCWVGTAGENSGPYEKCEGTSLRDEMEYNNPLCIMASIGDECVENNDGGLGDGCNAEDDGKKRDQTSCEAYQPAGRDLRKADESFDGTTRHCRWIPAKTEQQKKDACAAKDGCEFNSGTKMVGRGCTGTLASSYTGGDKNGCFMRSATELQCTGPTTPPEAVTGCTWSEGTSETVGECARTDASAKEEQAWQMQSGTSCSERLKAGCFENNDGLGGGNGCPDLTDESSCLAKDDGCSKGTCSGNLNASNTDGRQCTDRSGSQHDCTQSGCDGGPGCTGCTYKAQCCKWVPPPADKAQTCIDGVDGALT